MKFISRFIDEFTEDSSEIEVLKKRIAWLKERNGKLGGFQSENIAFTRTIEKIEKELNAKLGNEPAEEAEHDDSPVSTETATAS
jgi:hypothetical protein